MEKEINLGLLLNLSNQLEQASPRDQVTRAYIKTLQEIFDDPIFKGYLPDIIEPSFEAFIPAENPRRILITYGKDRCRLVMCRDKNNEKLNHAVLYYTRPATFEQSLFEDLKVIPELNPKSLGYTKTAGFWSVIHIDPRVQRSVPSLMFQLKQDHVLVNTRLIPVIQDQNEYPISDTVYRVLQNGNIHLPREFEDYTIKRNYEKRSL